MSSDVVRLKPFEYVHIHDSNSSVTYVLTGPATYTLPQHEALVFKEPRQFVSVPPRHFAVIECPVVRDAKGNPKLDSHGQVRTALGEKEIRFESEPMPLYPGEKLLDLKPLITLDATQSIVLRAARDFEENDASGKPVKRNAGDEWMVRGPCTYVPRVEHDFVEKRDAIVVGISESLKLRAKNKHIDATGVERAVGEEYLWSREGAYTLSVDETLVSVVKAKILTGQTALHVEVTREFVDKRPWAMGVQRLPGQVYLVTDKETSEFTPTPYEKVQRTVNLITVTHRHYAVVLDPVVNGVQQLGRRLVVTNCRMFLKPGERLENGVQEAYTLAQDEGIVLSAIEEFEDKTANVRRAPGDTWLLTGPLEYIPHPSVRVVPDKNGNEKRRKIVLAEGEGVYVRNTQTGEVRAVIGGTVMLDAAEELWEKDLPKVVEEKLARQGDSVVSYIEQISGVATRDRTRVVRFKVPHNAVTQVYDYKKRTQRTIFGPDMVLLGPEEQFTVLSLSGSEWDPKRPNLCLPKTTGRIKALYLFLGPSTLTDVLEVETSDHARLELQLSYDWYFEVAKGNATEADQCFSVPDFVGDCCSCIASRVRASVAGVPFDQFHKHSSTIVNAAVFGVDPTTKEPKSEIRFPNNRLIVTAVDVQGMSVLDEKTRIALQQSVKRAIQNTTESQESAARQEASVREQQAQGMLDRQVIADKADNERHRKGLIELETQSSAIASSGQAKAEARARSEAAVIEAQSTVTLAKKKAQMQAIVDKMNIDAKSAKADAELTYRQEAEDIDLSHQKSLTEIESAKFGKTIGAIGKSTITALARAGPELQARLLKSMGLQGYLVTDGTNPINLFNAAQGMTAGPTGAKVGGRA